MDAMSPSTCDEKSATCSSTARGWMTTPTSGGGRLRLEPEPTGARPAKDGMSSRRLASSTCGW
eukprot:scaffold19059_cov114-Isochrysis_galbana.AAC.3